MKKVYYQFTYLAQHHLRWHHVAKPILLILMLTFFVFPTVAQYVNLNSGDFDIASNWNGNITPFENWKTITIKENSTITKAGDFSWAANVTSIGVFKVNGNCTAGDGGVTVEGEFSVTGIFNNILKTTGTNAKVSVGSIQNGIIDVGAGSVVNVLEKCTLTNGSFIRNGGTVIVYGDFDLNSAITIEKGGTLIIHGNFNGKGNWGMSISGNIVVKGNFSASNGTIQNVGNVVVGGNVEIANGGFGGSGSDNFYVINPDANITVPSWWSDEKKPGDLDDFNQNEQNNTDLNDLVESLMPEKMIYSWIGSEGSQWENAKNWSRKKVPAIGSAVLIDKSSGNQPVISGNASMLSLTVKNGSLTIKTGSKVTVANAITVDSPGSLTIENDFGSQPTSFVYYGTSKGNVSVKNSFPALARNWYIGHPVASNSTTYSDNNFSVWKYNHSNGGWIDATGTYSNGTEAFVVKNNNGIEKIITHIGSLHGGDQTFVLYPNAPTRWNLLTNPFNAYVEPKLLDMTNVEPTIWYRTVENNSYKFVSHNVEQGIALPTSSDKLIAPNQAFWLRATGPGSITFKRSPLHTVHSNVTINPGNKSAQLKADDVLYLELDNGVGTDQMAVAFRLNGTDDYTTSDSEKRLNDSAVPNIFSLKSGKDVAINILPELSDEVEIPLGIATRSEGEVVLRGVSLNEFMPDMEVWLHDGLTGDKIDLRTQEYSFRADAGQLRDRFVVSVGPVKDDNGGVPTLKDDVTVSDHRIRIATQGGKHHLLVGAELLRNCNGTVTVFNLAGATLSSSTIDSSRTELTLPDAPGVYVVEVRAGGVVKREKLMR